MLRSRKPKQGLIGDTSDQMEQQNMGYGNPNTVTYHGLPVGFISKWNNITNLTDLK